MGREDCTYSSSYERGGASGGFCSVYGREGLVMDV